MFRDDVKRMELTNNLLFSNVIPNTTRMICFHHFTIWSDSLKRLSIKYDPIITMFHKQQKESKE